MKKIGILVDESKINYYLFNFLDKLIKNKNCQIYIIKVSYPNYSFLKKILNKIKFKGIHYLLKKFIFSFILILEKLLLKLFFRSVYLRLFKKFRIDNLDLSMIEIESFFSSKYNYIDFDKPALNKIESLDLDFLVRGQIPYIIRGKILYCSKTGITSIHHGDNEWNRGGPPAFWEIYYKKESTGFVIQRLNESIDNGVVLFRANILTKASHLLNLDSIYLESYYALINLIYNYSNISASKIIHKKSTVNNVLNCIKKNYNKKIKIENDQNTPGDQFGIYSDNKKLIKIFGINKFVNLESGIKKMIKSIN